MTRGSPTIPITGHWQVRISLTFVKYAVAYAAIAIAFKAVGS